MYLIYYQKRNGDIFTRIRNTLPHCGLGNYMPMGWKVLDIKYNFCGQYLSPYEYHCKVKEYCERKKKMKKFKNILKIKKSHK